MRPKDLVLLLLFSGSAGLNTNPKSCRIVRVPFFLLFYAPHLRKCLLARNCANVIKSREMIRFDVDVCLDYYKGLCVLSPTFLTIWFFFGYFGLTLSPYDSNAAYTPSGRRSYFRTNGEIPVISLYSSGIKKKQTRFKRLQAIWGDCHL